MPLTQNNYFDYLESLAANHKGIAHQINGGVKTHFARVIIDDGSRDPFGRINISEILTKVRSSFELPVMVVVNYDVSGSDEGGGSVQKVKGMMFYLLDKAKSVTKDLSDVISVIDHMEEVADELLGFMREDYELAEMKSDVSGKMLLNFSELSIRAIGPIKDNLCGVKVEIPFTEVAESALRYNPDKFNDPL